MGYLTKKGVRNYLFKDLSRVSDFGGGFKEMGLYSASGLRRSRGNSMIRYL